jgi:hypothetical protein
MTHPLRRGISITIIGGLLTACGGASGAAGGSPTPVVGAAASPTMPGWGSPRGVPIPTADPANALLRYALRGSYCTGLFDGTGCDAAITVHRDGLVHSDSSDGSREVAMMTTADLQILTDQIATMDLDVMQATPFTGRCPSADDLSEQVITVFTPTGPTVLAGCTVAMDFTQPPLRTIMDVLNRYWR